MEADMIRVKEATSAVADVFVTGFWIWFWIWFLVGGWWVLSATVGYLGLPAPVDLPPEAGMWTKLRNVGGNTLIVAKDLTMTMYYGVHLLVGICYMLIGLAPIVAKLALPWPGWITRRSSSEKSIRREEE